MANINLTVRGSLFQTPVELRALFGNLNQVTQISERLAIRLGLLEKSRDFFYHQAMVASEDRSSLSSEFPLFL